MHSLPAGWVCRGYRSAKCAESNQCSRCPQHSAARNTVTTTIHNDNARTNQNVSFVVQIYCSVRSIRNDITGNSGASKGKAVSTSFYNVCRKQTKPWSWAMTSFATSAYLIAQCTAVWKNCFADIFHSIRSPTLLRHEKWLHLREWPHFSEKGNLHEIIYSANLEFRWLLCTWTLTAIKILTI